MDATSIAQLPEPPAWPLVGHTLMLDKPRVHLQMEAWAKVYGPMYRLRLFGRDVLVVADIELFMQASRDRPHTWRRLANIEATAREAGVHGLFTAEGSEWERQRRLVMHAFDPRHLRNFFPRLAVVTQRLLQRWQHSARDGAVMDLQAELMCYAVDAVAGLAFGVDIDTIGQERSELNEHLQKVVPGLNRRLHALFPYWRYVRLPADRALERHLHVVRNELRVVIASQREQLARDPALAAAPSNLLQSLLAGDAQGSDGPLTDDEIIGNLFTILLAGQETTISTIAWTFYLVSTHRDAWRRLVAEADERLAASFFASTIETADALTFAQACANEAMRLHPVGPLHYMQACCDTVLGGVAVPKGTYLFCLARLDANDPARVPQADTFWPERWLGDAAELKRLSLPFGAGPRICPGRNLAMLEMRMVLSMLARNFEIAELRTEHGGPPAEIMDFAVHPQTLHTRLKARAT